MTPRSGSSAARTEDSTMVSLGELLHMEERRVDTEEQQARRRAKEAQQRLRNETERRAREQAAQREAEEQKRLTGERKEAEEAARLVGQILGLITKVKIETEAKEREKEAQALHARFVEIETLSERSSARRLRWGLALVSLASVLLVGSTMGFTFAEVIPEAEQERAQLVAEIERRDATIGAHELGAEKHKRTIQQLEAQSVENRKLLTQATDQIASLRKNRAKPPTRRVNKSRPKPKPDDPFLSGEACKGSPDPLCGLQKR